LTFVRPPEARPFLDVQRRSVPKSCSCARLAKSRRAGRSLRRALDMFAGYYAVAASAGKVERNMGGSQSIPATLGSSRIATREPGHWCRFNEVPAVSGGSGAAESQSTPFSSPSSRNVHLHAILQPSPIPSCIGFRPILRAVRALITGLSDEERCWPRPDTFCLSSPGKAQQYDLRKRLQPANPTFASRR